MTTTKKHQFFARNTDDAKGPAIVLARSIMQKLDPEDRLLAFDVFCSVNGSSGLRSMANIDFTPEERAVIEQFAVSDGEDDGLFTLAQLLDFAYAAGREDAENERHDLLVGAATGDALEDEPLEEDEPPSGLDPDDEEADEDGAVDDDDGEDGFDDDE